MNMPMAYLEWSFEDQIVLSLLCMLYESVAQGQGKVKGEGKKLPSFCIWWAAWDGKGLRRLSLGSISWKLSFVT
jgi:hypothetical protein